MHHMGSPCFSAYSFLLHRCEELQHSLFIMCSHAACVHLQGEKKERFNEIKQELSQISTKFSNNLLVGCIFAAAHVHPGVLQAMCQGLVLIGCRSLTIPLSLDSGRVLPYAGAGCHQGLQEADQGQD